MELEEEIQQARFENEHQKLVLNIMFTASWLESRQLQLLKPHDLSPQQYNVLRILRGQHPNAATVSLLTERMLDRSSNASRLVEKLRLKALVEREECPHDRRAVNVCITEKGLELLRSLDPLVSQSHLALQHVSDAEARQMNVLLNRLRD